MENIIKRLIDLGQNLRVFFMSGIFFELLKDFELERTQKISWSLDSQTEVLESSGIY